MKSIERELKIGSRESALAVIQAELVGAYLKAERPDIGFQYVTMKTTGDRFLNSRLDEIGGKGLFVKELDEALISRATDLSVHSLKDMPMEIPEELPVIGYSKREDPRDVLVLPKGVKELDLSKPFGTSSKRRILQLKELYPGASFENVRGNVATRLRKLDEGNYCALILAGAGLKRLGLEDRISRYFTVDEIIPSAGQGILSLQGRKGEDYSFLEGFCSEESRLAAEAERAFVRALGGGCTSPIAAHAEFEAGKMILRGFYYDEENETGYRKQLCRKTGHPGESRLAGEELAKAILAECGEIKE